MRLIITEKNNSAKKISEILSGGDAKSDASYRTPFYTWTDAAGAEQTAVGLKGHVLNPAFPEGYSNWQETDPKSLIDAGHADADKLTAMAKYQVGEKLTDTQTKELVAFLASALARAIACQ